MMTKSLRVTSTWPIAIRRRHLIQSGLEHSKRVARFVRRALAVGVDIAAGERLRSKGGIPRRLCQCSMQFGGTHGQYAHQRQVALMRIRGYRIAGRRGSMLFEITLHILERMSPTITLI